MVEEVNYSIVLSDNVCSLQTRYNPSLNLLTKTIEGRNYDKEQKVFTFPLNSLEKLKETLNENLINYEILNENEYNNKCMNGKNASWKMKDYKIEELPSVKIRPYSKHYLSIDLPIAGKYYYQLKKLKKIIHEDCWLILHQDLNLLKVICDLNEIPYQLYS